MNEATTEYVIRWWPAIPSEGAGKSLVQVDAIYESFLINHCRGRIRTPPNAQWQWNAGERRGEEGGRRRHAAPGRQAGVLLNLL